MAALPDADASKTLENGHGERLQDGDGTNIECRVQLIDPESPDRFAIEARVSHETLPHLELRGQAAKGQRATLNLELRIDDAAGRLESSCFADATEILPGAVWFTALSCDGVLHEGTPTDCRLEGAVLFEQCTR